MARISIPVELKKTKRGYRGTIYLKMRDGSSARVSSFAKTPAGSIMKASALAASMANNPIFQAIAPPGTTAAIKAVGLLAKGVGVGNIEAVAKRFVGKGAKRLMKKLKFW